MTRATRCACAVVALVMLVACESSGPTASGPSPDPEVDRAAAKAILLTKLDMPKGWTAEAPENQDNDSTLVSDVDECVGIPTKAPHVFVEGDTFFAAGLAVGSSIGFMRTQEDADRQLTSLRSAKTIGCVQKVVVPELVTEMKKALKATRMGAFKATVLNLPRYGKGRAGFRIAGTVTLEGTTEKLVIDAVFIYAERAEVSMMFLRFGGAFNSKLQQALIAKVVGRLNSLV